MSSDTAVTSFEQLNLIPTLLDRLAELGYQQPTEIQGRAIPSVLAGSDLIAGANTGSGKTATFALPLLQKLYEQKLSEPRSAISSKSTKGNFTSALILTPTRELAQQVADSVRSYAQHFNGAIKTVAVFGGVSVNKQMMALRGGCDVLVATPGRLLDLISSNAIKLDQLQTLVLDEADRMLSLGFAEELAELLGLMPAQKQTLLFSATFPEQVKALTNSLLNDPVEIQVQSAEASTLVQRAFMVNKGEKTAALSKLIEQHQWSQMLVFVNAKKHCENLAFKLGKRGINAAVFHGDKGQGARNRVLDEFKAGDVEVLIATDIAARGLDIEKLPVVINFDLPRSPADYMHRIGRSGRAGEVGLGISLLDYEDFHHFKIIEKKNKFRLEREQIEGFEIDEEVTAKLAADFLAQQKPTAPAPGTGKKKRNKKRSMDKINPEANSGLWSGFSKK